VKVHYYEYGLRWRAQCNNSFNTDTPTSTLYVKLFSNSTSLPIKTLIIMRNFKACLSLIVVGTASHWLQSPSQGYKIDKKETLLQMQTRLQSWGVLQCSNGLSNKVSNIIRRLMDNIKLLLICILRILLSHSFIFLRFYFLSIYIWFYSCLIM
jgi:hypothetical protein